MFEAFKQSSKESQKMYYLYLEQYEDLMPEDIRDEFEQIKNSISNDSLLDNIKEESHINNEYDFINIINNILSEFTHSVVEQGSYKLLWNDDNSPKKEEASQLLFREFVESRLKNSDIVISRETQTGRGPVDFKLLHGYKFRLLIEVKLASNSHFWHGLEKQLIQYMVSGKINNTIFLVIIYNKKEFQLLKNIDNVINNLNQKYSLKITVKLSMLQSLNLLHLNYLKS